MRGTLSLIGAFLFAVLLTAACAKPLYVRDEQRPAFAEAPNKSANYVKKAAISVKPGAQTPWSRQAEDLLLQILVEVIRETNRRTRLVIPQDTDYPAFMKVYTAISSRDAFTVTQTARHQGFHNLLQAAVENVRVHEEKTGFWWFRKNRHFLTVVLSIEVFDTFTGAKIANEVREQTVKIDPDSYAAFLAGSAHGIEAANALIARMAKSLGKQAAAVISQGKWVTSVAEVQNPQISMTPGRLAGLRVGDRLSIYEGRRIIDGTGGEKFIVPGHKVAEVEITAVDEESATASVDGQADIRPGDIAVPAS